MIVEEKAASRAASRAAAKKATVGFGAPDTVGAHIFRVEIAAARDASVAIFEELGYGGGDNGVPLEELRALLSRPTWSAIAETARKEFSDRLRAQKIATSRWTQGTNPLDRLLGKELCVLAWAAEHATNDQLPVVCARWLALRPQERWWLYATTAAEAGTPEGRDRGWRRALFFALSDGEVKAKKRKTATRAFDTSDLPLFDETTPGELQ